MEEIIINLQAIKQVPGTLAVFYPPVSVEQNHHKSVYVSKGGRVELSCALEHKGYPEVDWEGEGRH